MSEEETQAPLPPPLPAESPEPVQPVQQPHSAVVAQENPYWDITLDEAIQIAFLQGEVVRDLGGTVLTDPDEIRSIHDPGIAASDPAIGVDAALSAFDTQLQASALWNQENIGINNLRRFPNGVADRDETFLDALLSKRTYTGSQVFLRHTTFYEDTNALNRRFPNYWDTRFEAGLRKPLLRGAGRDVNLTPLVVAQLNTEATTADFETDLLQFIGDVEEAYWDLRFAYQDVATKMTALESAFATWERTRELQKADLRGGDAASVARAREQYYFFQAELQNSLQGDERTPGLNSSERKLRLLAGLPPEDGRMLRPIDSPTEAKMIIDWDAVMAQALRSRPELQAQRVRVLQVERQMVAATNQVLPQLDLVGKYAFQGYGSNLFGRGPTFTSAYQSLGEDDFEDTQLGLEVSIPLGYRLARSTVRNLRLQLARQNAILREQEHQIQHQIHGVFDELNRTEAVAEIYHLRLQAAREQADIVDEAFAIERITFDDRMDAFRRLADVESLYYRSRVDYAIALKNLRQQSGELLDYFAVSIAGREPTAMWGVQETQSSHSSDTSLNNLDLESVVKASRRVLPTTRNR